MGSQEFNGGPKRKQHTTLHLKEWKIHAYSKISSQGESHAPRLFCPGVSNFLKAGFASFTSECSIVI